MRVFLSYNASGTAETVVQHKKRFIHPNLWRRNADGLSPKWPNLL
ncbi:MAG TPA: hypothetical protein PKY12_12175 [Catalimonadaceae bacterium]|nr:hypothetical protein [Catalimonadaceae bacterium]